MKRHRLVRYLFSGLLCIGGLCGSYGQDGLFRYDSILDISLTGNLQPVVTDTSVYPVYFPQVLKFIDPVSGEEKELSVEVKARGNFRRLKANCKHLPLMVKFPDTLATEGTLFHGQRKLKLVLPCQGTSYVMREWLAYKIYNLINPASSFRTSLIRLQLSDSRSSFEEKDILGFVIENVKSVAARNGMELNEDINLAQDVDKETYFKMAFFQFMIGNTDWSIPFLHNMKVMRKDSLSRPIIIPYDFDHAGIVDAPYAIPPPPFELASVRQRLFRGFCVDDISEMDNTIALFQNLKKDIYELVQNAEWVEQIDIEEMIAYLDDFYTIIDNPETLEEVLRSPCGLESKSNVEIMGLGF